MESVNGMGYDPGTEYLLRKNKSKKKRKGKRIRIPNNNEQGKNDSEKNYLVENSNQSDNNDNNSGEDSNTESVSLRDGEVFGEHNENRVSLDAMMSKGPDYESANELEENELEKLSSIDKVTIEEESFESENNDAKNQDSIINTRALDKDATTYELEKFEKHALIIFNQKEIDGHQPRYGTEKDEDALTKTFKHFGFEVTPHNNLTKEELFKELKKFSERDFTDYGCVAVAILTHGSNNGMLRAKDQLYSEIEVINHFKDYSKPTLVTKPKIFIIQACRGTKIMEGVPVFRAGKTRMDRDEDDLEPYILPVEADLLILHSSYAGRASHRNELYGSWFIQALCKKIDSLSSTHDIESIITEVKREVAIDKQHEEYNKRTFEMNVNKQMPVMTSTLIRKLYLRKFGERVKQETYIDQLRRPSESKHEVLDANSPMTPLLVQFGPCSCFLDHFTYMRNCLKYFIEQNPYDETANNFLDVANTFEDGIEFNTAKDKMCKAISNHLMNNARSSDFYKYLYFYQSQPRQPFGNKN